MDSDTVKEYVRKYRETGDNAWRDAVVEAYIPLAMSVTERLFGKSKYRFPEQFDNLKQEALAGLVKTVMKIDPDNKAAVASFMIPNIQGYLFNYLRDVQESPVRLPRDLYRKCVRGEMEWPGYIRLDSMYGNGDDAPQFATSNRLKHEFIGACDPELENIDERLTLIQSISRLSLRHRTIIYWHFWHNKPQSDIARIIGLSQMQISRDMRAAIKHLREILSESGESSAFERELEWRRSA